MQNLRERDNLPVAQPFQIGPNPRPQSEEEYKNHQHVIPIA